MANTPRTSREAPHDPATPASADVEVTGPGTPAEAPDRREHPVVNPPETVNVPLDPPPPPGDLTAPATGQHADGTMTPGAGGASLAEPSPAELAEEEPADRKAARLEAKLAELQAKLDALEGTQQAELSDARARQQRAMVAQEQASLADALRTPDPLAVAEPELLAAVADAVGLAPSDVLDLRQHGDDWVVVSVAGRKLRTSPDDAKQLAKTAARTRR